PAREDRAPVEPEQCLVRLVAGHRREVLGHRDGRPLVERDHQVSCPSCRAQNASRSLFPCIRSRRVIAYGRPGTPRSSIGMPSPTPDLIARRNASVKPVPSGIGDSAWLVPAIASRTWRAVQTLAPPAPVPRPTLTSGPLSWSTQPAAKRSPDE